MGYGYLIVQLSFLLVTILSTTDRYLVNNNMYYKKTKKTVIIIQGFCIVANVIIMFIIKEIMIYIPVIQIILADIILSFYSNRAKKIYFEELLNIIVANTLQAVDSREIKKILLENYGKVYFVEDIEKCKNHIKNI
jgi:hypothetical protein